MKRSLDFVVSSRNTTPRRSLSSSPTSSSINIDASEEGLLMFPHSASRRPSANKYDSSNVNSKSTLELTTASVVAMLSTPTSFTRTSENTQTRRRTCDLDFYLREEGLIRHVFSYLNVQEHQLIRGCCHSWMKIVQTLAMDILDISIRSPITPSTMERAFVSVIHNYSTVRHIDLSGQRSLTDRDLLVLTSCFWSHLECISVNDCLNVTDFGLLSILNAQSQRLESISFRHCKQITGNAFTQQQITGRHPNLKFFDITDTYMSYTTINGLEAVFPSLKAIHASHTPAHLECLQHLGWTDVVEELMFLVDNELCDLPHLGALLDEFRFRVTKQLESSKLSVFQRTLLNMGKQALIDVPLQQNELMSALLYACENGLTNIIPALLTEGNASVDGTDREGASALCIAVANGLTDVAKLLLEHGADINRRTQCLATPLYIATEMNWDDVIDILLDFKAETTNAVVGGATALCVAAKNGNRNTVLRLLAAERSATTSMGATDKRHHTTQHIQAMFLACERGFVDIVRDILDKTGVHANVLMDNSVTPLYLACQMGHYEVVELLLQRGAHANFRRPNGGVSCLYIAAQEGKPHIVELLVRYNVNIHARMEDLSTALHIAARMGHIAVAQVLLNEGSCVNDQTRSGLTPLYIASEEGHLGMVQFFILNGADLNLQTKNGTTPLFVASQKGHTLVVRALLMAGANAHLPKNNGTYPMDAASLLGNYEVTQLLLQFGARVGGLSLHFAERRRDLKLQALLMERYYEQHFQRAGGCVVSDQPPRVLS